MSMMKRFLEGVIIEMAVESGVDEDILWNLPYPRDVGQKLLDNGNAFFGGRHWTLEEIKEKYL